MPFNQGCALIVGVGKHQYLPGLNVPQLSNEAATIAQALYSQGGYPQNQVSLLQDGAATRAALVAALQQLANTAQPTNIAIFYYTGHVDFATDGSFYLTTTDTQFDNDKIKPGTGLSSSDFLDLLCDIKAKLLLVILNSCFSGQHETWLGLNPSFETPSIGRRFPDELVSSTLATGSGRVVITSCQENEFSWIGNGNMTIFGQAFVSAIDGSARLPGRYISVYDLYNYLYSTVSPAVQLLAGSSQEPELTVLGHYSSHMDVAENPAASMLEYNEAPGSVGPIGQIQRVDPDSSKRKFP